MKEKRHDALQAEMNRQHQAVVEYFSEEEKTNIFKEFEEAMKNIHHFYCKRYKCLSLCTSMSDDDKICKECEKED